MIIDIVFAKIASYASISVKWKPDRFSLGVGVLIRSWDVLTKLDNTTDLFFQFGLLFVGSNIYLVMNKPNMFKIT